MCGVHFWENIQNEDFGYQILAGHILRPFLGIEPEKMKILTSRICLYTYISDPHYI